MNYQDRLEKFIGSLDARQTIAFAKLLGESNKMKDTTILEDIKTARRCMIWQGFSCDNKDCLNKLCPLNWRYNE